jgi:uncharacterized protein (UPF0262 family)
MNYIAKISLDENALIRGDNNKRERDSVITDLLESSSFSPVGTNLAGPFSLSISIINNKILVRMEGSCGNPALVEISIMPLKRMIKDYSIICESYFDAVKNSDPRKVEAIDMGRRGVHNEGAEILQRQLEGKLDMDFETARKLFSLIYLLQEK